MQIFQLRTFHIKGPKPLCIKFNKIDGFVISLDGKIKHLVLFD